MATESNPIPSTPLHITMSPAHPMLACMLHLTWNLRKRCTHKRLCETSGAECLEGPVESISEGMHRCNKQSSDVSDANCVVKRVAYLEIPLRLSTACLTWALPQAKLHAPKHFPHVVSSVTTLLTFYTSYVVSNHLRPMRWQMHKAVCIL